MPFLTLAIPTYNRADKLRITLERIGGMIAESDFLIENVEILVSNNASTDNTHNVLQDFKIKGVKFRFYNQGENLGLDGNMRFLYRHSKGDYVWFFSDDDVLFQGAIDKVFAALKACLPAALLFSFVQPIGSSTRIFNYPEIRSVITDPVEIVQLLARFPKLSIYVYKRTELTNSDWNDLNPFLGSNYDFIALAYTIFQKANAASLCVISEPLAGCDADFNKIRFSPETWGNAWLVFKHPYALNAAPGLMEKKRQEAYYDQIQALFAVKAGALTAENPEDYDAFIRKLNIKLSWLFQKPKSLGQLFVLKLDLVPVWVKYFSRSH